MGILVSFEVWTGSDMLIFLKSQIVILITAIELFSAVGSCVRYHFLFGLFLLLPHQIVVESLFSQQSFVSSLFDDFALVHHNDQIGITDRR